MPYCILYFYWKIHSWAQRSAPNDPMPGVMLVFMVLSFFNVLTVLCFIQRLFDIDFTVYISRGASSNKLAFFLLGPWTIFIYGLLKLTKIKEKAFSEKSIQQYQKRGYRPSSVFLYIFASLGLLIKLAWGIGDLKK